MAKLTNSEIQLVDTVNQEYHTSQQGYDYALNSTIQTVIQFAVELSAWADETPMPYPGEITYNGQLFDLTQADVDAYCAAHPQVCATGNERAEIISLLQSGGTTAPDVADVEGDPPPPVVEELSTEPSEAVKTPPVPEPRTTVTHKVKTSGSRLALRDGAAWQKVSENANKDNKYKGKKITMLNNGTKFILTDEGVGYDCEWSRVVVAGYEDQETYLYNKFTEKLPETPASLETKCSDKTIANPGAAFIDWTKKPDWESYHDPQTGTVRVVVPTEHASTGGAELTKRMGEAIDPGCEVILYDYGKKGGGDTEEDAQFRKDLQDNHLYFAQAAEWYLDPRPESQLKVLVQIPQKYVDALEEAPEIVVNPQTGTGGDIRWDLDENVVKKVTFVSNLLEQELQDISDIFETYAEDMAEFDGEVVNYDAREEAQKLSTLLNGFSQLLSVNNLTLNKEQSDELTIAFDENKIPVYVDYTAAPPQGIEALGENVALTRGIDSFKKIQALDNDRSANYIFLFDLLLLNDDDLPWTDWLATFTKPDVEIRPSTPTESEKDKTENPDEAEKLSSGMDDKPIKSETEKLEEDRVITSAETQKKVYSQRKSASDGVGDPITQDMPKTLEKIHDIPSAFNFAINKISVQNLMMQAAGCLADVSGISVDYDKMKDAADALKQIAEGASELPDWDKLAGPPKFEVPTMDFPDDMSTEDIIGSITDAIAAALVEILTQAFVEMIKGVLEGLIIDCDPSDPNDKNDFGGEDLNDGLNNAASPDEQDKKLEALFDALGILPFADASKADGNPSNVPVDSEGATDNGLGDGTGVGNDPDSRGSTGAAGGTGLSEYGSLDTIKEIRSMISDVSAILTPMELCSLISGSPNSETLTVVISLLDRMYPIDNHDPRGWTITRVKDLFSSIGALVDTSYCDAILNNTDPFNGKSGASLADVFCATGDTLDVRRSLLGNKGKRFPDDPQKGAYLPHDPSGNAAGTTGTPFVDTTPPDEAMTDDQIEEAIQNINDRKKKRLDELLDAIMDPEGNLGIPKTGPSPFCTKNPDGTVTPGFLQEEHPSMVFMQDKFINTILQAPYIAFASDSKLFPQNMITTEQVVTEIPGTLGTADGMEEEVVNPALHAMGISAIDVGQASNQTFTGEATKQAVCPHLRRSLEEMETNSAFSLVETQNPAAFTYELILPPDPAVSLAFEKLKDMPDSIFDIIAEFNPDQPSLSLDEKSAYFKQAALDEASKAAATWKIQYIIPKATVSPTEGELDEIQEAITFALTDAQKAWEELQAAEAALAAQGDPVADPCGEFDADAELEKIKLEIAAKYGIDPSSFVVAGTETPVVQPEPEPYVPAWDDDYILSIIKNPSSSTPEEIIRVTSKGEMNADVVAKINEIIAETGTDIANVVETPQQKILGDYVKTIWKAVDSNAEPTELAKLEQFIKLSLFEEIARDSLQFVSKRISESPYFGFISQPITVGSGAAETTRIVETPLLAMLNLAPDPTPQELACGLDPHLLKVEDAKKEMKDDLAENSSAGCDPGGSDGLGKEPGPMEKAMCRMCTKLIIRTYLIDYYLRGIFAFSAFKLSEEDIDGVMVGYLTALIVDDLKELDPNALESFAATAANMYTDYLTENAEDLELTNPEDQEAPGDVDEGGTDGGAYEGLSFLIKEQFTDVAADLAEMIGTTLTTDDVHKTFLEKLPLFSLPEPVGDSYREPEDSTSTNDITYLTKARFSIAVTGSLGEYEGDDPEDIYNRGYALVSGGTDGSLKNEYRQTKALTEGETGDSFNLNNGEFFLEEYVRVEFKDIDDEFYSTPEGQVQLGVLDSDTQSWWGLDVEDIPSTGGVISYTQFSNALSDESWFKDVRSGLRLVYLPPISEDNFTTIDPQTAGFKSSTSITQIRDLDYGVTKDTLHTDNHSFDFSALSSGLSSKVGKLEKAYEIYEVIEGGWITEEKDFMTDIWSEPANSHAIRRINPIPVAWVEDAYGTGSKGVPGVLMGDLEDTPEYKLMFEYVFPLKRYFTLLSAFTIQGVSSMGAVKNGFDETKQELIKLKNICDNSGDYTYMDPNIMCMGDSPGIKRAADNLSSLLEGCFSMDLNPCARGVGLSFPIKWFLQTPKFILRGIIELISPNIGLAKMISGLLKLIGICLPMPVISFALLPIDVFLPPPIGFGIGPPLYPLGLEYHLLGFGQIDLSLSLDGQEFGGETEATLRLGTGEEIQCDDSASAPFIEASVGNAKVKQELPKSSTAQKMAAGVKVVKQQQAQKAKEETAIEG